MPEEARKRRSDRVSLSIPIRIRATDAQGELFHERTLTQVISRYGAKILLGRSLTSRQEIAILNLWTNREAQARVVGQMGISSGGYFYGVELCDTGQNLWGIEFPPASESEQAAGRAVLECAACQTREVVLLNDLHLEVFQATQRLSRPCARCQNTTVWTALLLGTGEGTDSVAEAAALEAPRTPPQPSRDQRKSRRLEIHVAACVRTPQHGEEQFITENISRGGFCFKGRTHYGVGSLLEAAVPFVKGGANIFVPARVAWDRELKEEGLYICGVSYLQTLDGWR